MPSPLLTNRAKDRRKALNLGKRLRSNTST
jgi:hypothetical protein